MKVQPSRRVPAICKQSCDKSFELQWARSAERYSSPRSSPSPLKRTALGRWPCDRFLIKKEPSLGHLTKLASGTFQHVEVPGRPTSSTPSTPCGRWPSNLFLMKEKQSLGHLCKTGFWHNSTCRSIRQAYILDTISACLCSSLVEGGLATSFYFRKNSL